MFYQLPCEAQEEYVSHLSEEGMYTLEWVCSSHYGKLFMTNLHHYYEPGGSITYARALKSYLCGRPDRLKEIVQEIIEEEQNGSEEPKRQ